MVNDYFGMHALKGVLLKKVICPIDKSIFFQGYYLTIKGRRWKENELNLSVKGNLDSE